MSNGEIINKAIGMLVADYDRQDGSLSKKQVERILEKLRLSVNEIQAVYNQLDTLGISIEEEIDEVDPHSLQDMDEHDEVAIGFQETGDDTYKRLAIHNMKLLSAEDEVELGRKMELGRRARKELEEGHAVTEIHLKMIEEAEKARRRMIMANLRLVLHIAKTYVGITDLSVDDLAQEGSIGLMRAVEKYDHKLGYKFSTYATWWIRQSVTRALADRGTTIRLPVHVYDAVYRLKRAYKLLAQNNPEKLPSARALADELAWTIDKVHFIQQISVLLPVSLEAPLPGHDDLTVMDTLISEYESPEEYVERISLIGAIDEAMAVLSDRDHEVLTLRFGLGAEHEGLTLEEIGKKFGVTRERIRQIESKAIKRLQSSIRRNPMHALSGYREEYGEVDTSAKDSGPRESGMTQAHEPDINVGNSAQSLSPESYINAPTKQNWRRSGAAPLSSRSEDDDEVTQ